MHRKQEEKKESKKITGKELAKSGKSRDEYLMRDIGVVDYLQGPRFVHLRGKMQDGTYNKPRAIDVALQIIAIVIDAPCAEKLESINIGVEYHTSWPYPA